MENNEEYHDPDYPEPAAVVKEESHAESETQKILKTKQIIRREISNELEVRENEVMQIEQRLTSSRHLLHRLRYAIISAYYNEHKLKMTIGQIEDEIAAQRDPRSKAEIASLLRDNQRRIHPSVKKLLGKKTVDIEEIFKSRAPRNKIRRDYSAMLQTRNYTIRADTTKSLRPETKAEEAEPPPPPEEPCTSKPKKVPRHLEPKITNVVTLDEATRNKMKHRYRIIIGNTSKYAPAASNLDLSTHKWLLYIRGPPHAPSLRPIVTAVTVTLHHSYAPHHTVHLSKPPFHISRRGWGEFPAKIELHFAQPEKNRPAAVTHDIKLDRNYTGMQMLGAETIVDVWLYSTPEMLECEFMEQDSLIANAEDTQPEEESPIHAEVKVEPIEPPYEVQNQDSWLEFFNKESALDVDEMIIRPEKVKKECDTEETEEEKLTNDGDNANDNPEPNWPIEHDLENDIPKEILTKPTSIKKRIVKYLDPTTGKVYYLEMDRTLDLSKVQEIVINNKSTKISPIKSNGLKNVRKKKGMSLLKPEVKNFLKTEINEQLRSCLAHIENDHCYISSPSKPVLPVKCEESVASEMKTEMNVYNCLCSSVCRLDSVRAAVNYLVKKIPLISERVRDPDYAKNFPFVVESCERFWKLDFAKRRNIEWSRAKMINKILTEHFIHSEKVWRTKQILYYTRLHGFYPTRSETYAPADGDDWSWHDRGNGEASIKECYPSPDDITTLSKFDSCQSDLTDAVNLSDSDVEVDVDSVHSEVRGGGAKREVGGDCDSLTVLPVEREDDRLRFVFLERKCADIGVDLRNEHIGNGYSYSAVHAVMLSAVKCFAEELVRSALAAKLRGDSGALPLPTVWAGSSTSRTVINLEHVYAGLNNPRLHALTSKDVGTERKNAYAI